MGKVGAGRVTHLTAMDKRCYVNALYQELP
jgi:hypothetical protein